MRKPPGSGLPAGPVSDRTGVPPHSFAGNTPRAGVFALSLALMLSGCSGDTDDAPTGSLTETAPGTGGTGPGTAGTSPTAAPTPAILTRLDLQLSIP